MNESDWPESVNGLPVPYGLPIDALSEIAVGPAPERWPAFYAIGRIGTNAARAILVAFAKDRDPYVRRIAIEVLGRFPADVEIDTFLLRALGDAAGAVARTACEVVGSRLLETARPALRQLAHASDIRTRIAAVRALAKLGCHEDIDVAESLMAENNEEAHKEGAFACRSLVSLGNWRRLAYGWLSDPVPRHRIWAAELLAEFGSAVDRLTLDSLCVDPDGHVRSAAQRATAALSDRPG